MYSFLEQFKTLADFIYLATNERPYLMDSNFNKPEGPYITCKVVNCEPSAWAGIEKQPTDERGMYQVFMNMVLTYNIVAVREDALFRLLDIAYALREPNVNIVLRRGGLAYSSHTPPVDSSLMLGDVLMEERAAMSIRLNCLYARKSRGEEFGIISGVKETSPKLKDKEQ